MKNLLNKLWIFPILTLALLACEKDEEKVVLSPGSGPAMALSTTTLALKEADAAKTALSVTLAAANYGFASPATYKMQFDRVGNGFQAPQEISLGSTLSRTFTTAELNQLAIKLGIAPGTATDVEVRVKSELTGAPALFSAVSTVKITPYLVVIVYPSLYVPGSYQGWSPDKAKKIVSVKDNKNYEGYINFPDASTEFKLTDAPNWNNGIFGDEASSGTSGKIASPGNNFKLSSAGYYLLKADLESKVWSAQKTIWGVIGSATPGGWGDDTNLNYDATTDTWKATMVLSAGEIKFRANDGWDINLGDTKADRILEYGGDNIAVAAGTYDIELILGVGGNYTYRITKK